jgi:hypothetical protein
MLFIRNPQQENLKEFMVKSGELFVENLDVDHVQSQHRESNMDQLQFEINQVLPFVPKGQIKLGAETIKVSRFMVFKLKGTSCVACGLQATFFKKEKTIETTILNLYGVRGNRMVLFTRDHIIPVSRGGTNDLSNIQPMCCECNGRKGDFISFKNQVLETGRVIKRFFHVIYQRTKGTAGILKAIWRR